MNNSKMIKKLMPLLAIILCSALISGCSSNNNNTSEKTEFNQNNDSDIYIDKTEIDIVEMLEIKKHKLFIFEIAFDEFSVVYDEYYIAANSDEIKACDIHLNNVDDNDLKGKFFKGLSIEESRERLSDIGVDLEWLDNQIKLMGNPNHKIYISDIIPGYSEEESMILVKHEMDIWSESDSEKRTIFSLTRYKFKKEDGVLKILTSKKGYGFTYHKDESMNEESLDFMMHEFESRTFADGDANYVKVIDLNNLKNY